MRFNYKPARGFPQRLLDNKNIIAYEYKEHNLTLQMISSKYHVGNQMAKSFLIHCLGEEEYFRIAKEIPSHCKRVIEIEIKTNSEKLHRNKDNFSKEEILQLISKIKERTTGIFL